MTDTLTALGLEVGRAQVDNDNGSMIDTFFVQTLSGKKLESGATHMLSQAFQGAAIKQRVAWGLACNVHLCRVRWKLVLHLAGS